MHKHRRKPISGQAIQWAKDRSNDSEMAEFVGFPALLLTGTKDEAGKVLVPPAKTLSIKTPEQRVRRVEPGDWVIKTADGMHVSKEHDFEEAYEEIPEEAPAVPDASKRSHHKAKSHA